MSILKNNNWEMKVDVVGGINVKHDVSRSFVFAWICSRSKEKTYDFTREENIEAAEFIMKKLQEYCDNIKKEILIETLAGIEGKK